MTPLTLFSSLPPTVSVADVAALLSAAGLTAISAEQWIAQCASGDGAPVLFIVVSDDPAVTSTLKSVVQAAVARAERVIAVWPQGSAGGLLPSVLEDYGASVVSWIPSAVHAAICKQGEEWQDANGAPRAQPPIDRNKNC